MKILIAPTIYIESEEHLKWLYISVNSFYKSSEKFDLMGFVNHLNPKYKKVVEKKVGKLRYNGENNLSKSWNKAISYGIKNGYDYVIVPNLDIQIEPDTIKNLVDFAQEHGGVMWSGYCTNRPDVVKPDGSFEVRATGLSNYDTYAFYMVNTELFKKVGKFDTHYQAYCEDVDMEHRIGLAGEKHWCVRGAEFTHDACVTLRGSNEENKRLLGEGGNGAEAHFLSKWGGRPRFQIFKHPFDNEKFGYKYVGGRYGGDE